MESNTHSTPNRFQKLFEYLCTEHSIIPIESDMQEIENIVLEMNENESLATIIDIDSDPRYIALLDEEAKCHRYEYQGSLLPYLNYGDLVGRKGHLSYAVRSVEISAQRRFFELLLKEKDDHFQKMLDVKCGQASKHLTTIAERDKEIRELTGQNGRYKEYAIKSKSTIKELKQQLSESREQVEKLKAQYCWYPMKDAPRDGRTIELLYEDGSQTFARWSERPVCMLGTVNGGFPPGWATSIESGTDVNLPLDPPLLWREFI